MDEETRKIVDDSAQAFQEIQELQANPGFVKFMAKLQRQADEMAISVLEGQMPTIEREELRLKRLGIMDVLRAQDAEIAGHRNILEPHGMIPPPRVR